MTSEVRALGSFTGTVTDSSVDLDVTVVDGEPEVRVHGPEGQLASVQTEVRDGTLTITSASGTFGSRRVEVRLPKLEQLGTSASGDVTADAAGADLRLLASGSGDVDLRRVGALEARVTASGDVTLRQVGSLDLSVLGAGDVDAREVDGSVTLVSEGSGDVHVKGRVASLRLEANRAGDVEVEGIDAEGTVVVVAGGSGDVELTGRAEAAEFTVTGAGDVDSEHLQVREAEVTSEGSGDIEVHATEVVRGRLGGAGGVSIQGGARSEVVDEGAGDVEVKGR